MGTPPLLGRYPESVTSFKKTPKVEGECRLRSWRGGCSVSKCRAIYTLADEVIE
jgi:hypothetical protein